MGKTKRNVADASRREFLKKGAAAGIGAGAVGLSHAEAAAQGNAPRAWDLTADFVAVGAGVAGLTGAVSALDHGASVLIVEENFDIGGHGMLNAGSLLLGGGTMMQKKHGVQDSAEQVFQDWVSPGNAEGIFSDRDLARAWADENAATFDFLVAAGVQFEDQVPRGRRQTIVQWPVRSEVMVANPGNRGSGLVRALEKNARGRGAKILLRHKMTSIIRESPTSGRVLGITAMNDGRTVRIEAKKGVLLATGGHSSNLNFRRIFDPRLTEEYQVVGEPYTQKNGDGELAAIAVGAVLWGTGSQTMGFTGPARVGSPTLAKTTFIGCRWGFVGLHWPPESPIFKQARASGLGPVDWQNAIMVNQAGRRFWDEEDGGPGFFKAAMAYSENSTKLNGGGPIWAIFDAEAVTRQKWDPTPPNVDPEYFFRADTIAELARTIRNPYQLRPMPAAVLEATVARYNSFVDAGADADFKKPTPRYKIQTPPFYAAWSTPMIHDSVTGLRTNAKAQVLDLQGQVIPGLYAAGEVQGGFPQHGMGRTTVFGRIAGRHAALNGGEA